MKILYMGTAAVEGIPSIFCNCRVCQQARRNKGKDLRSRSQALINDDLLIEYNPDTYTHFIKYEINPNKISTCLITHSHSDHLYVDDIELLRNDYNHNYNTVLNFYVGKSGYNKIKKISKKDYMKNVMTVTEVIPFKKYNISHYEIYPLVANHALETSPLIYLIKDLNDNKTLLYAHDTGYFYPETLEFLYKYGHIDFVSIDCTGVMNNNWVNNHMSFDMVLKLIDILYNHQVVDDTTIKVVNHFSHNGNGLHNEIESLVKDYGFIVSYDGLIIEY